MPDVPERKYIKSIISQQRLLFGIREKQSKSQERSYREPMKSRCRIKYTTEGLKEQPTTQNNNIDTNTEDLIT
jgi:hypothetical protein